jgi:hypothetical protein
LNQKSLCATKGAKERMKSALPQYNKRMSLAPPIMDLEILGSSSDKLMSEMLLSNEARQKRRFARLESEG